MTFLKFTYRRQLIKYRCMVILGTNRISKRSPLILLDDARSSFFLFSSRESFPCVLFSLTLLPTHSFSFFTSLFDFFYNRSAHSWFYEIVEPSFLSVDFPSLHRCKFMGVLLIIMKYIDYILHDYSFRLQFFNFI